MSVTSMATQLSVRLDDDLEARLEAYINSDRHVFEPDKSDVVREGLDEFLPPLDELDE
jgi:Arc/MetJ-type ribon-helix-helix transcriptional regulator